MIITSIHSIHTDRGRSTDTSLDGQEGHASDSAQVCQFIEGRMVCLSSRRDRLKGDQEQARKRVEGWLVS